MASTKKPNVPSFKKAGRKWRQHQQRKKKYGAEQIGRRVGAYYEWMHSYNRCAEATASCCTITRCTRCIFLSRNFCFLQLHQHTFLGMKIDRFPSKSVAEADTWCISCISHCLKTTQKCLILASEASLFTSVCYCLRNNDKTRSAHNFVKWDFFKVIFKQCALASLHSPFSDMLIFTDWQSLIWKSHARGN